MKRHFGRTLVLLLLGLMAAAAGTLRTEWAGEKVCAWARGRLPELLGMEVSLGRCEVDAITGEVEIRSFSATPRGAGEPLLSADRLLVRVRTLQLLFGRLVLERVEVERPKVRADLSKLELPASGEKSSGCFVDALDGALEVENLAINGADVRVIAPGDRVVELEEADLDLRLSRRAYATRLGVPRGTVRTGQVQLPLSRLRLSSALDLDKKKLTINHLEVALGELALFARGDVETLCEPSLGLEATLYLPLDLVSTILGPEAPKMSGNAVVNLKKLEGSLDSPSAELEVTLARAKVEGFDVGDAYLEARLDKGQLKVGKLDVNVAEKGKARISGSVGLSKGFPVTAAVDLEEIPFAKLLDKLTLRHAWVDFRATGHVDLKGELVPFHLGGPGSVDVRDFHVYGEGWDNPAPFRVLDLEQAHVDLMTDFNPERVRLFKGVVRTARGSDVDADVTLNFDPHKGFHIEANPHEVDLADLKHLIGIPIDGKLAGHCLIKVVDGTPRIDGQMTIREFRFHKLQLGTAEAQVQLRGSVLGFPAVTVSKGRSRFNAEGAFDLGGDKPRVRASMAFEQARLADLLDAIGDEHWIFDPLRGKSDARISGTASIDSPVLEPHAVVDARLEDFTWLERKFGDGRLVFRALDGKGISLEPIELDGPCGKLTFAGRVMFDEGLDFLLEAPALYPEELAKPNGEFLGMRGALEAKLRFFGPTDHVQATGSVLAKDIAAFGVGLGGGTWDLQMDRTTMSLKGPLGTDLLLDGRLVFEGDMPFAVGVSASTADLGHYFPSVAGLKGTLQAEALATGTVTHYEEARGDVWVPSLTFGKGDWSFVNEGPIALSFQGSLLELKAATLKGTAGTNLTASGVLDGDLDVSVDGRFDARALELFMPWLEQTAGAFQVSATVSGPPSKPEVVGVAALSNGRFTAKGYPVSAKEMVGRFEFSQNRLFLRDVDGVLNNTGRVRALGELVLKDFVPQRYDLSAMLDEVPFKYPENIPTTFSGELKLYGQPGALILAGDVDMVRFKYTDDFDLDSFINDPRRRRVEAKSFEKREEWLRYDVRVNVPPGGGSRIDNNIIKLSFKSEEPLHLTGTNVHMGLQGTLLAEEGGRGFFHNNEFWISRGAVSMSERDRIAYNLDVHAETQVRDYRVLLHATGPWEDPEVVLTSEPSLDRGDIVALLFTGVTSQGAMSTQAGVGLVGEALMNVSGLDRTLKKFVPKNTILRDFNFHISTQYSDASQMVEPTAEIESKILSDDLRLRLSQPVISGKGRRAQAEYRFNENTSIQMQWDNDSSSSSLGDLGLDLKLRWELD
ncbi:MAG TPA: translocation/assembly module TamB domain-containing protein [Myxococcales bacterium]|jgi:translocation and assembly module TamB